MLKKLERDNPLFCSQFYRFLFVTLVSALLRQRQEKALFLPEEDHIHSAVHTPSTPSFGGDSLQNSPQLGEFELSSPAAFSLRASPIAPEEDAVDSVFRVLDMQGAGWIPTADLQNYLCDICGLHKVPATFHLHSPLVSSNWSSFLSSLLRRVSLLCDFFSLCTSYSSISWWGRPGDCGGYYEGAPSGDAQAEWRTLDVSALQKDSPIFLPSNSGWCASHVPRSIVFATFLISSVPCFLHCVTAY